MASIITWFLNSILIQASIIAFATPFWVWYQVSRPTDNRRAHHSLGEHVELFFSSKQMNWLVFCWAASEAVAWFIIPEFLLLLIIFMRIRQRPALLIWDFAGTIVGTIFAFVISAPAAIVVHMPYVTLGMVAQVNSWYLHFGVGALAFQPLSGIPYKVFTNLASINHINLLALVVVGVAVRMARYIFIYVVLSGLYPLFHHIASRRYISVFMVSCLVFSFFLLKTVNIYGVNYQTQSNQSVFAEFLQKL